VVVSLTGNRQENVQLLDAVISVSQELRLREVLQRIVGYACELVDARFGALGIAGPDHAMVDVIYEGVTDAERDAIGEAPTGHGLLGELITNPTPLRLANLSEHPAVLGFPANHPAMRTFLGVPLRINEEIFGNLYVTEKRDGGEFTEADERTLVSLATAAGIAVENARMYERSRQRERWLQASNEIAAALLSSGQSGGELRMVTQRARTIAGVPAAAIALPHPDDDSKLVFEVVDGLGQASQRLVGTTVDVATTASGMVFSTGKPLLLEQYGDSAAAWHEENNGGAPALLQALGSAAIVPLAAGDQILGVLLLIKLRGEEAFGEPDLELLRNFAAHAAIALQYAKARADQRRLAVFEERDRIASDMQELVVRRLFDISLDLQGVGTLVPMAARGRVARLVAELDETIGNLRRSIFSLQEDSHSTPSTVDNEVLRTVAQSVDALGFEPRLVQREHLEGVVPQWVRPDLLATLREALANVARHANAGAVNVELGLSGDYLELTVIDDGVGITEDRDRNSGLANLSKRATRWGGTLTVKPSGGGGTRLTWRVRVR
jgi:signal transduction histidine kinase